jgi:transposase
LQLARNTVRRYLRTGRAPTRQRGARPSQTLAPQREWLNAQIDAGTTSAPQLHRGLIERGVRGSVAPVRRYVTQRLAQTGTSRSRARSAQPVAVPVVTARQLRFQWVQHPGAREADVSARLKGLRERYAALEAGLKLADEFARLIRKQAEPTLTHWLEQVAASACPELRGFAAGLEQDLAAVRAALETPWSNGPVEGQVNQLKMLKRQMYGRAGLNLLRKRAMAA